MMKRIFAFTILEIVMLFAISGISSTLITSSTQHFQLQITANESSSTMHPVNVPTSDSISGSKDNLLNPHSVSNVTNELLHKEESQERAQNPVNLELEPLQVASEVGDLLKRNSANDTSSQKEDNNDEDDSDEMNDTILIKNPNVKDEGKTHDEDSKVDGTVSVIDTTSVNNDTVNPQLRDNTATINDNAQMDINVNHTRPYVETSKNKTIIIGTTKENLAVSTESINTITMPHNNSYDYDKMNESQITGCGNNNNEVSTSGSVCNSTIVQIHINSTTGSDQQNNSANSISVVTKVQKEVDVGSVKKKEENSQIYVKSDARPKNKDHATTDAVFRPTEKLLDTVDDNSDNLQRIENKEDDDTQNSDIQIDRSPGILDTTGNVITAPPSHQSLSSLEHAEHSHKAAGKSAAFLQPTESAAILAGVFVSIALFGYVGLLVWRRILEKRYGNREMLVNEDDFYDTSDLRHFEL